MRMLLKVLAGVVICVVILAGVTALYLRHVVQNPDRYLPKIVAALEQKTGKQISIRHIQVSLSPLVIHAYNVQVKDPKPFPPGDFLNIPQLDATLSTSGLLARRISIQSLVLDHPVIDFISDPDGLWNFQNRPNAKIQSGSSSFSMGSISSLQIKNGVLMGSALIDPMDKPGPVVLMVRDFSAQFGHIDPAAFRLSKSAAPVHGTLTAGSARFGKVRVLDLRSQLLLDRQQLSFKNFNAKTYRGSANGNFTFSLAGKRTRFDTDLRVNGLGIDYLLTEFATGPPKMTGMMEANLKLGGIIEHTSNPLAGLRGNGTFTIRNGQLPSLNNSSNMKQMKRFRDKSAKDLPASAFATFGGDMDLDSRHIHSKRIGVNFYGIDVDGAGKLTEADGEMDYRGNAIIENKQGFFTDLFAQWFKDAKMKDGRLTFPIRVAGTLKNPKFSIVH